MVKCTPVNPEEIPTPVCPSVSVAIVKRNPPKKTQIQEHKQKYVQLNKGTVANMTTSTVKILKKSMCILDSAVIWANSWK